MIQELRRQRKVHFAGFEVQVAVPERTAARISSSPVYRRALRPTAQSALRAVRWVSGTRRPAGRGEAVGLIPAVAPTPELVDQAAVALIQQVASLDWYHAIHVGHGVVTPGLVNHYADLGRYPLPESLAGMRCLDAAPRDGFWAFEMERRGAAEVVALDLESAERERERTCFVTAAGLLGSRVDVRAADLYQLASGNLGQFDLIVITDKLHMVRDPQLVLEGLYAICKGQIVLSHLISNELERFGDLCLSEFLGAGPEPAGWWLPNTNTVRTMMGVAGFTPVDVVGRFDGGAGPTVILHGQVPAENSWSIRAQPSRTVQEAASPASQINPDSGPARREKRLTFGRSEVVLAVAGGRAGKLADSAVYRRLLRPAITRRTPRAEGAISADAAMPIDVQSPPAERNELLAKRVEAIPWYHTIELGHGIVTPGFVDHRAQVPRYHLPESLAGMRCLDVATFDGFWAFEMERRGAAEVVATDISDWKDCDLPRLVLLEALDHPVDKPMGLGFGIAHEALKSNVRHQICSVYDLSPERVGRFDFVFLGDLLLHLRDPQLALQRIGSVCRGKLWMGETYEPALEGYGDTALSHFSPWLPSFTWWIPSTNTLLAMLSGAGFTEVEELDRIMLTTGDGAAAKVVVRAQGPASRSQGIG